MIDDIDRRILAIVQANARTPNTEVARQIGMAPSATFERLRKLEERGLIMGYTARLNPRAVGLGLLAFIFVRADEQPGSLAAGKHLAAIPEVLEVHDITGEDCYLIKVRAADTESLARLLRDKIGAVEGVRATRTTIVMASLKESATLPLDQDSPPS